MLADGDFAAAKAQLERARDRFDFPKDRALYDLDLGLLQHYLGNYRASNTSLERAERAMDAAFTTSLSRAGASLLLNDNILEYAGEDYETVYVNIFKALNYLALDEFDSAFVEIRRIDEKLKVLEDRSWKLARKYENASELDEPFTVGKNRFRNSALGRWLSLLIYRAEGRPDEAAIDLQKIEQARALAPSIYNFRAPDLSAALQRPARGTVRVSFLGLTGQAPEKRADTLWIHTQADHIFIGTSTERAYGGQRLRGADILYWPGMEPGYTFKLQLPNLVRRGSAVHAVHVWIDGQPGPVLQQIESLENAAVAAFEIKQPLTLLKTVSRTVAKGIAAAQAQRKAEENWGDLTGLLTGILTGIGVGVSENADLRIAHFFPARAAVAEADLTPGLHHITFDYITADGLLLFRDERTVDIGARGINLIESYYLN